MPNKHAAEKSLRKSIKATEKNREMKTQIKKIRKQILEALKANESAQMVDKAAKGSTLHRNTANRFKARLAAKINAAVKPTAKKA
jgi:small subunit ribosomal protein S20